MKVVKWIIWIDRKRPDTLHLHNKRSTILSKSSFPCNNYWIDYKNKLYSYINEKYEYVIHTKSLYVLYLLIHFKKLFLNRKSIIVSLLWILVLKVYITILLSCCFITILVCTNEATVQLHQDSLANSFLVLSQQILSYICNHDCILIVFTVTFILITL